MNQYQFLDRIKETAGDKENYLSDDFSESIRQESELLLVPDEDRYLKSIIGLPVKQCLSMAERLYLKAILNTKYAKLFMTDNGIEMLMDELKDVPQISFDELFVSLPDRSNRKMIGLPEKIRMLLKAIRSNREIFYSNKTNKETYINKHGFPVRIEYSVRNDKLWLSLWSTEEQRPVKLNIHTMYDIGFTDNKWNEKKTPCEMMETKRCEQPIFIEFHEKDKNNIFERALMCFSAYDVEINGIIDGQYSLTIMYYDFDKEDILDNIMSFGPFCKVISPPEIVDEIKNRINLLHY